MVLGFLKVQEPVSPAKKVEECMFVVRMEIECSMIGSMVGSMVDSAIDLVMEDEREHKGVIGELAVVGNTVDTAAIAGPGMTVVVDNLTHDRMNSQAQ